MQVPLELRPFACWPFVSELAVKLASRACPPPAWALLAGLDLYPELLRLGSAQQQASSTEVTSSLHQVVHRTSLQSEGDRDVEASPA